MNKIPTLARRPFCGCPPAIIGKRGGFGAEYTREGDYYCVQVDCCGTMGPHGVTVQGAAEAWNKRRTPAEWDRGMRKALREAAQGAR